MRVSGHPCRFESRSTELESAAVRETRPHGEIAARVGTQRPTTGVPDQTSAEHASFPVQAFESSHAAAFDGYRQPSVG
jgi:hypothetical protein